MIELPPKRTTRNVGLYFELSDSELLRSINYEYLYWDKVKYKAKDYKPDEFWSAVKFSRDLNRKRVSFGRYSFSYTITDYMLEALHFFDLNIGGALGSNIDIADTDRNKYIISSIMEEAISSSQMEGAATTRRQAKDMLQQERKPRGKSEQMIMNNYITIRHVQKHKEEDLTPEKLLHIHSLIAKNTLDKPEEEGVFRNNNDIFVVNCVTSEAVHQPPTHEEIPQLINDLCRFFNSDKGDFIHPIIKGIIIHFMIAWIHPFTDGNGRTARTLFYWYMLKRGYWLTEYMSISRIIKGTKGQYEKAYLYTENDENDLGYFVTYHLRTMERAFDELKKYLSRKQKEVNQAASFLKIPGINHRQAQIIKLLCEDADRVLSIKDIESRFQISSYTARTDLKGLVDTGFLSIIQVNKIKQNFVKSAQFDSLLKKYNL